MRSEWKSILLHEIAQIKTGKLNSNAAVANGEYPFFTCSPEILRINKYSFDEKAVLLAGNNAEGNFNIKYYEGKFNAYQRTYIITSIDDNICNLRYLYFALKLCLQKFKLLSQGTSTKFLTLGILNSFEMLLPPLHEQKNIAAVLSALDDKIELNNRINQRLEEMAQAIFKSWFVDFEPFKGGEFVESELGPIPKGWRTGTLSDLGEVIGGSTPSKAKPEYYTENGISWIAPKDLSIQKSKYIYHGETDITDEGLKNSSAKLMPSGSVLFSSRAPIGYIAIAGCQMCTNQGFKSVVPYSTIGTAYTYYFLKENLSIIEGMASGSTFKEISGSTMKSVPAIIPDAASLSKFNRACAPVFSKQEILEQENIRLAVARDTLLPKLMSGELRVPCEAE